MKKINKGISRLILIFTLLSSTSCTTGENNMYGKKIQYNKNETIEFPDFTLRFIGERKEYVPVYAGHFLYYDFEITAGSERKTVSWTSGTGDIGPVSFRVNNKDYLIEMAISDIFGRLSDNEIVVWTKGQYEKKVEELRRNRE